MAGASSNLSAIPGHSAPWSSESLSTSNVANAGGTGGMADGVRVETLNAQEPLSEMLYHLTGMRPSMDVQPGDVNVPSGLESLFSGDAGSNSQKASDSPPKRATVWQVLHPTLALALGLYVSIAHAYDRAYVATAAGRSAGVPRPLQPFWVFATLELLLQSAQYFLEGISEQAGMLTAVAGFIPGPWKGRVRLLARYNGIWTTLASDALVVVWVLGVGAWWHGHNR